MFKLKKILYWLKKTPGASYEILSTLLISLNINKSKVDTTIFIKNIGEDMSVSQIYVNDILFREKKIHCHDFATI